MCRYPRYSVCAMHMCNVVSCFVCIILYSRYARLCSLRACHIRSMCGLAPLALFAALYLRCACFAACATARISVCATQVCNLALLVLSASYCRCAILAGAACSAVCLSVRAVRVRLGASRLVYSMAFVLCLFVQNITSMCLCPH